MVHRDRFGEHLVGVEHDPCDAGSRPTLGGMRTTASVRTATFIAAASFAIAACSDGDPSAGDVTGTAPSSSRAPASSTTRPPEPNEPPATTVATLPAPTTESSTVAPPATPAPTDAPSTEPSGGDRDFSAIDPIVSEFVARAGLDGAGLVIVDRDDGVVHEEYWGEFDADRVSFIASSSKMITAGVLMKLHDDGVIDIDAPVAGIVEWATDNPEVTVAQLLSSSSGLVGLIPDPSYPPYECQWVRTSELERCAAAAFESDADDADVVAPDTEFRYGGVQWQVAGAVAETVTGKTWAELIDEIYVEPCGVTSLGYDNQFSLPVDFDYPVGFDPSTLDPTENPNMEAGAYIDAPDYATLLLMHLRGGECPGGSVMSAEAIAPDARRSRPRRTRRGRGDVAGLRDGLVGRSRDGSDHRPGRVRLATMARPRRRVRRLPRRRGRLTDRELARRVVEADHRRRDVGVMSAGARRQTSRRVVSTSSVSFAATAST